MKLSILIPVVPVHEAFFTDLYCKLVIQIRDQPVEILHDHSKAKKDGGPSTGQKRQSLLERAIGEDIVFIDADDEVPGYYVSEMLRAGESGCDCVAINGKMTTDGKDEILWRISKDYENETIIENGKSIYLRKTNHITAVKRTLALKAGFSDTSLGEDKYYSDRVAKLCKTEFKLSMPMYYYKFSSKNKLY